jgi:hypothetical protein
VICARCHEPIEDLRRVYHEVTGWEHTRKQGGANTIHLRERTGAVMHEKCMEDTKFEKRFGPKADTLF